MPKKPTRKTASLHEAFSAIQAVHQDEEIKHIWFMRVSNRLAKLGATVPAEVKTFEDLARYFGVPKERRGPGLTWQEVEDYAITWAGQHPSPAAATAPRQTDNGRTYTYAAVREMTGFADDRAWLKCAKETGVPTAKQGGRDHTFTPAEVRQILSQVIATSNQPDAIKACRKSLEKLQ